MKKKTNPTYKSQDFAGVIALDEKSNKKRIQLNAPALLQHFLDHECTVGDQVSFYVTNKKRKRSMAQNNYYHLYLSLISLSSGHTLKELKKWAVGKFLSRGIKEVFGDKVRMTDSSADLNILEFIEFLERLEESTGIPLPDTAPFLPALTHQEYEKLKGRQREIYEKLRPKIKL